MWNLSCLSNIIEFKNLKLLTSVTVARLKTTFLRDCEMQTYLKSANPTLPLHSSSRKERLKEGVFSLLCHQDSTTFISKEPHLRTWGNSMFKLSTSPVWQRLNVCIYIQQCFTMSTFLLQPAECDNVWQMFDNVDNVYISSSTCPVWQCQMQHRMPRRQQGSSWGGISTSGYLI